MLHNHAANFRNSTALAQRWPKPPTISCYAMAILSVAVAIVAADVLTRLLHAEPIASSMLCVVIFAAWFGGFGPVNAAGVVPSRLTGVARWEIATDVGSEPEKWRLHRAMHDAHRPFCNFVYTVSETGFPIYIQTSGKPFYDTSGNFLGYRGTGTEITATIRANHAEEALRKARAELAYVTRVTTLGEMRGPVRRLSSSCLCIKRKRRD